MENDAGLTDGRSAEPGDRVMAQDPHEWVHRQKPRVNPWTVHSECELQRGTRHDAHCRIG
jgi:hypothetical protein